MGRYLLLIAACLMVTAAMGATLTLFLRRLRRIERERWGEKAGGHDRKQPVQSEVEG